LSALSGIEAISANGYSAVKIAGSAASDTLDFSRVTLSGIASIDGGSGDDIIVGSSGNDVILGGAGNDSLSGGDGDDVFQVGSGAGVDSVNGGAGHNKIVALANGATIGLSALSGIEAINANGYSAVKIAGSTASDTLDFSGVTLSGIASIDGGSGDDTIVGSIGNDVILGGAGNDSLSGGVGDDTLTGGAGSDQLSGGAGADLFIYSVTADSKGVNIDTIADFQSLQGDRVDLSAIDANSRVAGDQAFAWIGDSSFHKIAGELREAIGTDGNLHVYGDTSGDGKADFELIVRGTTHLVGSDFIL
jgi:serralysin